MTLCRVSTASHPTLCVFTGRGNRACGCEVRTRGLRDGEACSLHPNSNRTFMLACWNPIKQHGLQEILWTATAEVQMTEPNLATHMVTLVHRSAEEGACGVSQLKNCYTRVLRAREAAEGWPFSFQATIYRGFDETPGLLSFRCLAGSPRSAPDSASRSAHHHGSISDTAASLLEPDKRK